MWAAPTETPTQRRVDGRRAAKLFSQIKTIVGRGTSEVTGGKDAWLAHQHKQLLPLLFSRDDVWV